MVTFHTRSTCATQESERSTVTSWQARTAYAAAAIFTLASGSANALYGFNKGTDIPSGLVWLVVSIAVTALYTLAWPAFFQASKLSMRVTALVAIVLAGAYSVTAALGSAAGGRLASAATASDTDSKRARAQASLNSATVELAKLAPSRTTAELKGEIGKLFAANPTAGNCSVVDGPVSRSICPKVHALIAEKGRAQRRAELEGIKTAETAKLDNLGPATVANSDAAALVAFLQALGVTTDTATLTDKLNKSLILLAVLIVECGGGLSLAVGMALSESAANAKNTQREHPSPTPNVHPHRSPIQNADRSAPEQVNVHPLNGPHVGSERSPIEVLQTMAIERSDRGERSAHERVLQALQDRGGVMIGSQGVLGGTFGWSKTRMNDVLHDLADTGLIKLTTGRSGTIARLVQHKSTQQQVSEGAAFRASRQLNQSSIAASTASTTVN